MPSFDIVSEVDLQEVDNAVNQAMKEITTRYDFRGSKSKIELNKEKKSIALVADDDFKMNAVVDILQTKFVKRGLSLKAMKPATVLDALGGLKKQDIGLINGIETEIAKKIVKSIKESKMKVQGSIQQEQVRVSGKNRDDLQEAIQFMKSQDFGIPLQFNNFRD